MATFQLQRSLQRRLASLSSRALMMVPVCNTNTVLNSNLHAHRHTSFHTQQPLMRRQPKIDMDAVSSVDPVMAMRMRNATTKKTMKMAKEAHVLTTNRNVDDISLNTLTYLPGAKKKKIRVGRGRASRRGRTAGRGMKGQKSRTSVDIPSGFEGGMTPIYKRVPKYGFSNRAFSLRYQPVTLEKLQYFIDTGRINPEEGTITMKTLYEAGLVSGVKFPGIKLLSNGKEHFKAKVDIELPRASKAAIHAIEKNGGSIRCIYFGKRALHALLHPEKYAGTVKMSMPPPKLFKYYMDPEIRGYLADSNPAHPLRDLVPDNEKNITMELGDIQLEEHLRQKTRESKKGKKKRGK